MNYTDVFQRDIAGLDRDRRDELWRPCLERAQLLVRQREVCQLVGLAIKVELPRLVELLQSVLDQVTLSRRVLAARDVEVGAFEQRQCTCSSE